MPGSGAVNGPLAVALGGGTGPGSADTGDTVVGAAETVGVIVLGSELGETIDGTIEDCRGSAADALSKALASGEVGVEADAVAVVDANVVGLWSR